MLGSLFFLIRECGLNLRRQGLMVLACVSTAAIALSILGVFLLLAFQVYAFADAAPRQFEIHAFMNEDATREQTLAAKDEVARIPGVAHVQVVTKEEAWKTFRSQSMHKEELDGFKENPLPDKLQVVASSPELTLSIAEKVRSVAQVAEVKEGKEDLRKLLAIFNLVRVVGLALGGFLVFGAAALISNAIRMTLFARRRDIRVMQLVGATNSFIRLPFVLEGIVQGSLGGAVASGAILLGLRYYNQHVMPYLPFSDQLRFPVEIWLYCVGLAAAGAFIGMVGSMLSLRKFMHHA